MEENKIIESSEMTEVMSLKDSFQSGVEGTKSSIGTKAILVGIGTAAAGGVGYAIYRFRKNRLKRAEKLLKEKGYKLEKPQVVKEEESKEETKEETKKD